MYYSPSVILEAIKNFQRDRESNAAKIMRYYQDLKELRSGDTIGFGRHDLTESVKPISKDPVKRTISWEVIDKQGDCLLLLSEHILDWEMVGDGDETWEASYIRELLNGEYYDAWFTAMEKTLICSKPDPVFLLSVEEARKYFGDTKRGRAVMLVSEYERCGEEKDDLAPCIEEWPNEWWLRTPGTELGFAYVDRQGDIDERGFDASADEFGIRPAIWLDLKQLIAFLLKG